MTDTAQNLARLRVATATGRLPRDLGLWLLEQLEPPERNELLRAAADLVDGSRWVKATTLADMLAELRALPGLMKFVHPDHRPMHWVQRALRADPETPGSVRQLLRILD